MHRFRAWARFERAVLGLGLASIVLVHAPFIGYKAYANVDEAYACALASRLLDGYKLYQGAISQRGPLMYYAFEAFAWLHGWDNILALRIWALVLAFAHVGLVYLVARRALSRAAAIVAAGVSCYALSFGFPTEDGVAINGEVLQLPAMLLGTYLQIRAMLHEAGSRDRRWRLMLGAVLLGASMAIKQGAIVHLLPVMVWIASDARRHRQKWILAGDLAAAILGSALVPFVFVLHAAANGTLRDMYYYTVVYNRDVHMKPAPSFPLAWLNPMFGRLVTLTGFFAATIVIGAHAFPTIWGRLRALLRHRSIETLVRGFGPKHYIGLHFVIAITTAASMYRFFPHYFVQALPFFSLAVGAMLERAMRRVAAARSSLVGFMIFTIGAAGLGCYFGEKVDGRAAHDETVDLMSRVVTATTMPEERIFVWGFSPWIYGYSHRRPAGRYVFSTYVTGFVPWFPESLSVERARIVPGSVEGLLSDLEKEKPVAIVDAGSVMMLRPMRTYSEFSDYLHAHYCFDMRLGAMDLYRRKPDGDECAQKSFPRPAIGVDYLGRTIAAPLPKQVDVATSRRLPEGNYFKPIYFLDGPRPRGIEATHTKRREKDEAEARARGLCVPELGKPHCEDP
jgi:hypothetical protein